MLSVLTCAACDRRESAKRADEQPRTQLESQMANSSPDDPKTLQDGINRLTGEVRALQDQLAALPKTKENSAQADAMRERLDDLENELFGLQQLAVKLNEFSRPDLRLVARSLHGLCEEWNTKWAEILGRPQRNCAPAP